MSVYVCMFTDLKVLQNVHIQCTLNGRRDDVVSLKL